VLGILLIKTKFNFSSELDIVSSKRSNITKYDGLDPEISGGRDNNLYPRPITFTLGLNVNF
jgi:hypothetical protein